MKTTAEVKAYLKKEIVELTQEIEQEQMIRGALQKHTSEYLKSALNERDYGNQILALRRLLDQIED